MYTEVCLNYTIYFYIYIAQHDNNSLSYFWKRIYVFRCVCVSQALPPPLLPHVSAEADTHSNVQIYQEGEIERGSAIGCGVRNGEGGREVECYLQVSVASRKNRIVSSILGIKAKPDVIVSTILTAADRP